MKHVLYRIFKIFGHQDWIRFGVRARIIRLLIDPDSCDSYEFETNYFGLKYRGNLNEYIDWCVYFFGAHEKPELMLVKNILCNKKAPVGIDIGANSGTYSIFMSKFCKEVYSFEPNKKIIGSFLKNMAINNIKNVFLQAFALGDKNCKLTLLVPKRGNSGWASIGYVSSGSVNNDSFSVDVVTGDEIIGKCNLQNIDFIKIDVQEFGKNVLIGLKKTIKRYHPIILLEVTKSFLNDFSYSGELSFIYKKYNLFIIKGNVPFLYFFTKSLYQLIKFDSAVFSDLENILCLPN